MAGALFRVKNYFFVLLVLSVIFSGSFTAFCYVMPVDQILGFMVKNFSDFRSVNLIQSTLQTVNGNEKVFTEQLWLESPDKYSTKALDRLAERDVTAPDIFYRQLLIANSREKIERILLTIGIDISKTSYTRLDGKIAYRIGDKTPGSPELIVEKERFIPLLLIYRVPGKADGELITVKFEDYHYEREYKGWYPFEITYKEGENFVERYTLQNLQVNIPIDASILKSFPEYELPEVTEPGEDTSAADSEDDSGNSDIDKEQLKNVIKAFEDEYQ